MVILASDDNCGIPLCHDAVFRHDITDVPLPDEPFVAVSCTSTDGVGDLFLVAFDGSPGSQTPLEAKLTHT
jgi:hypothetical protein